MEAMHELEWTNWAMDVMQREIILRALLVEERTGETRFSAHIFTRFTGENGPMVGHLYQHTTGVFIEHHDVDGPRAIQVAAFPEGEEWNSYFFMRVYHQGLPGWLGNERTFLLLRKYEGWDEPLSSSSLLAMQHLLRLQGAVCQTRHTTKDGDETAFLSCVQYRFEAFLQKNLKIWRVMFGSP